MLTDVEELSQDYLPQFYAATKPLKIAAKEYVVYYEHLNYLDIDSLIKWINEDSGFNWEIDDWRILGDTIEMYCSRRDIYNNVLKAIHNQCFNCGSYKGVNCKCDKSADLQNKYKEMIKLIGLFQDKQRSNYMIFPTDIYSSLKLLICNFD